jgi:hypothetical protein
MSAGSVLAGTYIGRKCFLNKAGKNGLDQGRNIGESGEPGGADDEGTLLVWARFLSARALPRHTPTV